MLCSEQPEGREEGKEPKRKRLKSGPPLTVIRTYAFLRHIFPKVFNKQAGVLFLSPLPESKTKPCIWERPNLYSVVIARSSSTSEACSLPSVPCLPSLGPKKWTTENVPLNGTLCTDTEPQSWAHVAFPSWERQRRNRKVLVTFVWFIDSFV